MRTQRRFAEDRARERGREIRVETGDRERVHADELRLDQALANLVDNALRYGEGDVLLSSHRTGGGTAFEVSDAGEGFPLEFAERAFERFARGDEARTRTGTGLGLSIVRAIAEDAMEVAPRSRRAAAPPCGSGSPMPRKTAQGHLRWPP